MAAPKTAVGPKSDKVWREAIHRAIKRPANETLPRTAPKLEFLADQLVLKGMDGDVPALREIGDRIDGKPTQATEISGPNGQPIKTESKVDMAGLSDDQLRALATIKVS